MCKGLQFPNYWWFYLLVAVAGALLLFVIGLSIALILYCIYVHKKANIRGIYYRSSSTVYALCHSHIWSDLFLQKLCFHIYVQAATQQILASCRASHQNAAIFFKLYK